MMRTNGATDAASRWTATAAPERRWTADAVAARFVRFAADRCAGGYAPLYQEVIGRAADDPFVLELACAAQAGQSPPDLLLAAVHRLLLDDPDQELADFYPTLRAAPEPPHRAYPAFRRFCMDHADALRGLLRSRLVQTNEVRRCTYLWPALSLIAQATARPLALCEVGASAGLNLHCDRYGYDYSGTRSGNSSSQLQLACDVRGDTLPSAVPVIEWRCGLDLHPLDVADADDVAWLRALVWADHVERLARLDLAVDVARAHPVEIVTGDACADVGSAVADAPAEHALVVFHTATAAHMPPTVRTAFDDHVRQVAAERALVRVEAEPRAPGLPRLRATVHAGDTAVEIVLGDHHPHGTTLTWRPDPDATRAFRTFNT